MITLFISYAQEDEACAEILRYGLEAQGYHCWRAPAHPTPTEYNYPRMIESAILGSAALILLWNAHALQSLKVTRHLLCAQQFRKLILPVTLDGTELPLSLSVPLTLLEMTNCEQAAIQLRPHLPPPTNRDPFFAFVEKAAAYELIGNRYVALELAADMLARQEHYEEVKAVIDYLARRDLMIGVREKAQKVLETEKYLVARPPSPIPRTRTGDAQFMFGLNCTKCGHVTYYDRRKVCSEKSAVVRANASGGRRVLDEVELGCAQCGYRMTRHVDCEGC